VRRVKLSHGWLLGGGPLPVLAGLSQLAHCGHVINRWVEMTSRKMPRKSLNQSGASSV
jgi:hypothetical protein